MWIVHGLNMWIRAPAGCGVSTWMLMEYIKLIVAKLPDLGERGKPNTSESTRNVLFVCLHPQSVHSHKKQCC